MSGRIPSISRRGSKPLCPRCGIVVETAGQQCAFCENGHPSFPARCLDSYTTLARHVIARACADCAKEFHRNTGRWYAHESARFLLDRTGTFQKARSVWAELAGMETDYIARKMREATTNGAPRLLQVAQELLETRRRV